MSSKQKNSQSCDCLIFRIVLLFFFASDVPPSQKLPPHGYPLEHPFNKVSSTTLNSILSKYSQYSHDGTSQHKVLSSFSFVSGWL